MNNKLLLFFILLSFNSTYIFSQWNNDPAINTAVCLSANDQQDVRIVSDYKQGAIIAWVDFRNDPSLSDIFVQRIISNGNVSWTNNGIAICSNPSDQGAVVMAETGNGNIILVWEDMRNGNRDIYAQKIDTSGTIKWTTGGIPVCSKILDQRNPRIISDGTGGALIVWEDSVNGSWDLFLQRINPDGTLRWNSDGILVCAASFSQINPRIETDDASGAIIVWQDKRNNVDYDIYAQRVDSSGAVKWTLNGVSIASITGTQSNPKIEPDHAGGGVIVWQDKRNGNDYNVYAQRINSSGVIQWLNNGIAVCSQSGSQSAIDITSEYIDGTIITWKDNRNGNYDIYYQMVDNSGNLKYNTGGNIMSNSPNDQLNPSIIGDGSGGAIIVWQDSSSGTWDIYSGKINSAGVIQWKLPVGTAIDNQTNPKNISDGAGGVIFAWQDKRNAVNKFDIYSHHIPSGGITESIRDTKEKNIRTLVYPNPFSISSKILLENTNNNSTELSIQIFDISGREMNIECNRNQSGFDLFSGSLADGIYLYRINVKNYPPLPGYFLITD